LVGSRHSEAIFCCADIHQERPVLGYRTIAFDGALADVDIGLEADFAAVAASSVVSALPGFSPLSPAAQSPANIQDVWLREKDTCCLWILAHRAAKLAILPVLSPGTHLEYSSQTHLDEAMNTTLEPTADPSPEDSLSGASGLPPSTTAMSHFRQEGARRVRAQ